MLEDGQDGDPRLEGDGDRGRDGGEPNDPETDGHKIGPRFFTAMACYVGIALLAAFTLDGNFRTIVWIFLGFLVFRTYLLTLRKP